MAQGLGADARERYDSALAGVWGDLSRTLSRLEALAADPDELDEDALDVLPHLQYALHRASELTAGIDPPSGEEGAHEELAAALLDARDLTAEVTEALGSGGGAAVSVFVHEWRAMGRDSHSAASWGDALRVWLLPPGWSRDGSTHTAGELRRRLPGAQAG